MQKRLVTSRGQKVIAYQGNYHPVFGTLHKEVWRELLWYFKFEIISNVKFKILTGNK